jgi:hypothetical protein
MAAFVCLGTLAAIFTSSLSIWAKLLRVLYLGVAVLVALAVYGAASFVGAVLAFILFACYLNIRLLPQTTKKAVPIAIWLVMGSLAIGAVPYCLHYNSQQLSHQPERIAELVIHGGITAKRAARDLEALPPSALRQRLAGRLERALIDKTESPLMTHQKLSVLAVLVAWHDPSAIPYIQEAVEKGYLPKDIANAAVAELEGKKSA